MGYFLVSIILLFWVCRAELPTRKQREAIKSAKKGPITWKVIRLTWSEARPTIIWAIFIFMLSLFIGVAAAAFKMDTFLVRPSVQEFSIVIAYALICLYLGLYGVIAWGDILLKNSDGAPRNTARYFAYVMQSLFLFFVSAQLLFTLFIEEGAHLLLKQTILCLIFFIHFCVIIFNKVWLRLQGGVGLLFSTFFLGMIGFLAEPFGIAEVYAFFLFVVILFLMYQASQKIKNYSDSENGYIVIATLINRMISITILIVYFMVLLSHLF